MAVFLRLICLYALLTTLVCCIHAASVAVEYPSSLQDYQLTFEKRLRSQERKLSRKRPSTPTTFPTRDAVKSGRKRRRDRTRTSGPFAWTAERLRKLRATLKTSSPEISHPLASPTDIDGYATPATKTRLASLYQVVDLDTNATPATETRSEYLNPKADFENYAAEEDFIYALFDRFSTGLVGTEQKIPKKDPEYIEMLDWFELGPVEEKKDPEYIELKEWFEMGAVDEDEKKKNDKDVEDSKFSNLAMPERGPVAPEQKVEAWLDEIVAPEDKIELQMEEIVADEPTTESQVEENVVPEHPVEFEMEEMVAREYTVDDNKETMEGEEQDEAESEKQLEEGKKEHTILTERTPEEIQDVRNRMEELSLGRAQYTGRISETF